MTFVKHKNSISISVLLLILMLIASMLLNNDIAIFQKENEYQIPNWFIVISYVQLVFAFVSVILIYFYKKVGVYLFPLAVLSHFVLHVQFLDVFQYFSILLLFIFTIGFVAWVPKWERFS